MSDSTKLQVEAFKATPLVQHLKYFLGNSEDWLEIERRLWGQYNRPKPDLKFGKDDFLWSDLYYSELDTVDFQWWFTVWQWYQKAVASFGPKSRVQPFQKAVKVPWPWMAGVPRKVRKKYYFPDQK